MKGPPIAIGLAVLIIVACSGPVPPVATMSPTLTLSGATPSATPRQPGTLPTPTRTSGSTPSLSPTVRPATPPTPATTLAPTATPSGLVVDEAEIVRHLDALAAIADAHGGERSPHSAGYDASADYVANELSALGFQIDRQTVEFTSFREETGVLEIGNRSWSAPEWIHAHIYSGEGEVDDRAQAVGMSGGAPTQTAGCEAEDWSDVDAGTIAIVFGGACSRRQVVLLAQDAGARALISLYPQWERGHVLQPTLIEPEGIDIPAAVAGREPAEALLEAAADGTPVRLSVDIKSEIGIDDNIIAELPGRGDRVVMLGGHLDSVLGGPGINDNGSGVATLLALAAGLADRPQPELTVRLAFWAAEEFGTHGSRFYVERLEAERERIDAYLNLDMVGSPNAGYYVYDDDADPVSREITDSIMSALADAGLSGAGIPSGGSDHVAFWQAGVPFGGVFSGIEALTVDQATQFGGEAGVPADGCYHLPCDDRSNVDVATAVVFGNAVASVVEELAD